MKANFIKQVTMKLQAKDLMIGDWVYIKDHPIKSLPQKVKPEHFVRSLVEFESIPITPQILEKNGFVKTEENEFVHSYHLVIPITSKENSSVIQMNFYKNPIAGVNTLFKCWSPTPPNYEGLNEMHLCNLESVHELQHALRLCKIEKTIEL